MNDRMNHSQMMNPSHTMMNQPPQVHILPQSQRRLMNQQQSRMLSQSQFTMNKSRTLGKQMTNLSYGIWPPQPPTSIDMMKFPNPMKQQQQGFISSKQSKPRNWKGKKGNDMRKGGRQKGKSVIAGSGSTVAGSGVGGGAGAGNKPPTATPNKLQHQNRLRVRRFNPKKKLNRFAPCAPRNTSSFIIRAKKSGGIASLVSPCPVTPSVLMTPIFSPSREVLGETAKEEWGVDGYGSMKGLIRLRSPGHEADAREDEEEEEEVVSISSESDLEDHVEVERRLDHDLSRFEMIYPNNGVDNNNDLAIRVADQGTQITQLEEANLILKKRLFSMERELGDLHRRLHRLASHNQAVKEFCEEVVDNVSGNGSDGRYDVSSTKEKEEEEKVEDNNEECGEVVWKGEDNGKEDIRD